MKFERPSRIQALTLPMVLTPPYRSMVAQVWRSPPKLTCRRSAMLCSGRLSRWLHRRDKRLQAHNGSGKTTCFVLSMLSRVDPNNKQPQAS